MGLLLEYPGAQVKGCVVDLGRQGFETTIEIVYPEEPEHDQFVVKCFETKDEAEMALHYALRAIELIFLEPDGQALH